MSLFKRIDQLISEGGALYIYIYQISYIYIYMHILVFLKSLVLPHFHQSDVPFCQGSPLVEALSLQHPVAVNGEGQPEFFWLHYIVAT